MNTDIEVSNKIVAGQIERTLAGSVVESGTLDLRAVSSNSTLGIEIT